MKFAEALNKAENGFKVTHRDWKDGEYIEEHANILFFFDRSGKGVADWEVKTSYFDDVWSVLEEGYTLEEALKAAKEGDKIFRRGDSRKDCFISVLKCGAISAPGFMWERQMFEGKNWVIEKASCGQGISDALKTYKSETLPKGTLVKL